MEPAAAAGIDPLESRTYFAALLAGRLPIRPLPAKPMPSAAPVRVNAGGPTFTTGDGLLFAADTHKRSHGFVGGKAIKTGAAIANTTDDELFQTARAGRRFHFSAPVPNGDYTVFVEFSEPTATAAGQRTFDVRAERTLALDGYDVFAAAGGADAAVVETFDVTVTDRELDLDFRGDGKSQAIVSAVVIVPNDVPSGVKPYTLACADDAARVAASAINLRRIGLHLWLAAQDDRGRPPVDLAALVRFLPHDLFASPRADTEVPRGELSQLERSAWAADTDDYTLIPHANLNRLTEDDPLVYEDPARVAGDINVLFGDLHVETVPRAEALALLGLPPTDAPPADPLPPNACHADERVVRSGANLRTIADGLFRYSSDFKSRYPVDLGTLFTVAEIPVETFVNPRRPTPIPPDLTPEQRAAWVNANAGYVYVGQTARSSDPADILLAYEKPAGLSTGIYLLFNDGRVEFREMAWGMETIARAT